MVVFFATWALVFGSASYKDEYGCYCYNCFHNVIVTKYVRRNTIVHARMASIIRSISLVVRLPQCSKYFFISYCYNCFVKFFFGVEGACRDVSLESTFVYPHFR